MEDSEKTDMPDKLDISSKSEEGLTAEDAEQLVRVYAQRNLAHITVWGQLLIPDIFFLQLQSPLKKPWRVSHSTLVCSVLDCYTH